MKRHPMVLMILSARGGYCIKLLCKQLIKIALWRKGMQAEERVPAYFFFIKNINSRVEEYNTPLL